MNFDWLRQLRFRFLGLFRKRSREAGMTEEIRSHLETEATARRAEGLGDKAARQQAERHFGGIEQVKESCRDGVVAAIAVCGV